MKITVANPARTKKYILLFILLLVLQTVLIGAVLLEKDIEQIDTDDQWKLSQTYVTTDDGYTLDGYGDENRENTYVYANHTSGDLVITDVSYFRDIVTIEAELMTNDTNTNTNTNTNVSNIYKISEQPNDIDKIQLSIGSKNISTEPCSCVIGDYK